MGATGALAVYLSFSLGLITWILFLAWVSYYFLGKSLLLVLKNLPPMVGGVFMGLVISILANWLSTFLGSLSLPIFVFMGVGSIAFASRIKVLGNIPAWFIGLIVFFGAHPTFEAIAFLKLFGTILLGIGFAVVNDKAIQKVSNH